MLIKRDLEVGRGMDATFGIAKYALAIINPKLETCNPLDGKERSKTDYCHVSLSYLELLESLSPPVTLQPTVITMPFFHHLEGTPSKNGSDAEFRVRLCARLWRRGSTVLGDLAIISSDKLLVVDNGVVNSYDMPTIQVHTAGSRVSDTVQ